MEKALKTLHISPKVLARRTNALWDILLPTEQQAKELAGNVLNAKNLRLQTEYMGTCEDRMGAFFSKYGQVNKVKVLISKSGIATGDMELQIGEIPNILYTISTSSSTDNSNSSRSASRGRSICKDT